METGFKSVIKSTIISLICTIILQNIITFFVGDVGKIQILTSSLSNNQYQTIISIMNQQKSEYLNNVEIKVDDKTKVYSAQIDGKNVDKYIFNNIEPQMISTLTLVTNQFLSQDELIVIKNGNKLLVEDFNKNSSYKEKTIINIFIYGFCILITLLYIDSQKKKINKDVEQLTKKANELDEKANKTQREATIVKTIYIKEMNNMEKELKFYQRILLKLTNNSITKTELDKTISKELKTFTKKKMKYLDYGELYEIIKLLSSSKE